MDEQIDGSHELLKRAEMIVKASKKGEEADPNEMKALLTELEETLERCNKGKLIVKLFK